MSVTTVTPAQEALAVTTVLDTPAIMMPPTLTAPATTETEHELSVPETILPVQPATNESQVGASYLNTFCPSGSSKYKYLHVQFLSHMYT